MKKILILLLCLAICLSLLPVGAIAEETESIVENETAEHSAVLPETYTVEEIPEPSEIQEIVVIPEEPSEIQEPVETYEELADDAEVEILTDLAEDFPESEIGEKVFSVIVPKTRITLGESVQLGISCTDADIDLSAVVWTSSDDTVAPVDETGLVTALSTGKAYITAAITDSLTDTVKLTVADAAEIAFAGEGTKEEPWQIGSEEELIKLSGLTAEDETYAKGFYVLTADIALTSPWTPVGTIEHPFTGSFDGNGKRLTGLICGGTDAYFGLFGVTKDAVLTGITLENVCINAVGFEGAGGIVGLMQGGRLSQSLVTGTVNSDAAVCGGLVGRAKGAVICNCYTALELRAAGYAGGLAGFACEASAIEHSYCIGTLTSDGDFGSMTGGDDGSVRYESCYGIDTTGKNGTFITRKAAAAAQSFTGFDFESVWVNSASESYPYPLLRVSLCPGDAKWAPDTAEYAKGYIDDTGYTAPYSLKGVGKALTMKANAGFAAAYTIPNLPEVRNQNPYGTCWAHAIMASAETNLIKKGYATSDINLSELQFAWFHHSGTKNYAGNYEDPLNNFGGDRNYYHYGTDGAFGGDNYYKASKTLSSWIGPVSEDAVLAYGETNGGIINSSGLDYSYAFSLDSAHLENVRMIPTGSGTDVIKSALLTDGALSISYASEDEYYSGSNRYYYCSSDYYRGSEISTNHAVAIVGWDDTIDADYFYDSQHGTRPANDGAWIIRNSWGDYWGNEGYFYMSYDTVFVSDDYYCIFTYDFALSDNYDRCYQYDGSAGMFDDQYVYGNKPSAANVFTARGNDTIKAVSFWMDNHSDFSYKVKVYKNLTNASNPTSGTLASEVTGQTDYAGYYTLTLPSPVSVSNGEKFSVVLESTAEGDVWFSSDRSYYQADYYYMTSCSTAGQSFYSGSGSSWTDMSQNNGGNFRIKALAAAGSATDPVPAAPDIAVTAQKNSLKISWNAVDNAVSYRVYRSTSENGTYKLVASTSDTYFDDSTIVKDVEYYYKASSVSSAGKISGYGNTVMGCLSSLIIVSSPDELESDHPYENYCEQSWRYTDPGAVEMTLTFDDRTETEANYDYIYIYNGNDDLIGRFSGYELSGASVTVPGDTVRIRLTSDIYFTFWGFKVTEYSAVYVYTVSFDAADGRGVIATQTKRTGETLTLSENKPEREGYKFVGWATENGSKEVAYCPGDEYTEDADITLYAVWKISGDTNGDAKVNTKDFVTLMRYVAGDRSMTYDPNALDVTGEGDVNTLDFVTLMQYIAGKENVKIY